MKMPVLSTPNNLTFSVSSNSLLPLTSLLCHAEPSAGWVEWGDGGRWSADINMQWMAYAYACGVASGQFEASVVVVVVVAEGGAAEEVEAR